MTKKNMSMSILPGSMDSECIELCNAINLIPGLRTIESCCGHGSSNFLVFLKVDGVLGIKNLPELLYWLDPCHVGFRWWCKVKTDCAMSPTTFYIESEVKGEEAYKQAKEIADSIIRNLKTAC